MCMCTLSGKAVLEMTYNVLGGTLNPTHSLIFCLPLLVGVYRENELHIFVLVTCVFPWCAHIV